MVKQRKTMIYASIWVRARAGTRVRSSKLDLYVIIMGCSVGVERSRSVWSEETDRRHAADEDIVNTSGA